MGRKKLESEVLRNVSITDLAHSLSRYKACKHAGMTSDDHRHCLPDLKSPFL